MQESIRLREPQHVPLALQVKLILTAIQQRRVTFVLLVAFRMLRPQHAQIVWLGSQTVTTILAPCVLSAHQDGMLQLATSHATTAPLGWLILTAVQTRLVSSAW
jgi:hypothetical protein